jgi:hypothetical protein
LCQWCENKASKDKIAGKLIELVDGYKRTNLHENPKKESHSTKDQVKG